MIMLIFDDCIVKWYRSNSELYIYYKQVSLMLIKSEITKKGSNDNKIFVNYCVIVI